ncbi:homogentisate 1,2-dioxygenase [Catenulispora yoronensis]|uniref:Homogentisate 1,2-dioxygenase n=1 Tax=Catenulispora yoronensis TaxID=450799 RepID=A0ABN2VDR3_9ACTN
MPFYRAVGEIPRKRHTQFRRPDGALYSEELMGVEGFSSDSALLYHHGLPTAIVDSAEWEPPGPIESAAPNRPLKPRHFMTHKLDGSGLDAVTGRHLLLGNGDVRLSYVAATEASPLYRNAIGDECVYVESGSGVVETSFGALEVGQGDYVILPTSTIHRWVPSPDAAGEPLRLFVIEATGHIGPPKRYLSAKGQFLESSPYCERDLRSPSEPLRTAGEDVEVLVRHRSGGTRLTYAHHPFDVVGWDGCLYPYAFNIADFEPLTGRVHQPPPVHQTFEGPNFVICSFVPRKVDYHPLSIPVPYNHHNVDSDEVLFYTGGNYEARRGSGIGQGSISLHPSGLTHGPQPGAAERSIGVEFFDELAVMVDTFRPLEIGEGGTACEDPAYAWTWSGRHAGA